MEIGPDLVFEPLACRVKAVGCRQTVGLRLSLWRRAD
jgi:hypothetical protein